MFKHIVEITRFRNENEYYENYKDNNVYSYNLKKRAN